jgi:alanyl-tRNA synthetase
MTSIPHSAAEIREAFLSFFESKIHQRVASSSLVPSNDPTLLFTVAGMVQFKDLFLGREVREYRRAVSSQKCVRAGGKQNDLDNVGFTARHHTFFEMLGNFSFGDYFKAEAIAWAWEFVTQILKLSPSRLAVTVFKGEEGIPADDEAFDLWRKAGVSVERIARLGVQDNFWSAGDTGPCGPCSEIYYYVGGDSVKAGDLPGVSENWLEIWNLVFMQFERKEAGGALFPLPKPSIDTGSGLERVASVVQGKQSNYDTDLFVPILQRIATLAGRPYTGAWNSDTDAAMRVIADHARTTAFLVADGVQPSAESRGYVLRRIMRRAIRHGIDTLGLEGKPFFHDVVDAVISTMQQSYPELREKRSLVLEVARQEEAGFRKTFAKGKQQLALEFAQLVKNKQQLLPGSAVWDLHQTHGFPWDLTEVMAKENGFAIDRAGYEALLEQERLRATKLHSDTQVADVYMALAQKTKATTFVGYQEEVQPSRLLAIVVAGKEVQKAQVGDKVELIFESTPMYAESGGQVGDTGVAQAAQALVRIVDVQKPAGSLFVHHGQVERGVLSVGDTLELRVDTDRRKKIRANHSATHLLHRALRVVLGDTVNQKGSIVAADYLRFDFSQFAPVTEADLERIEDLVNGWIIDNASTNTQLMGLAQAKASGAVALFGEKYGEQVRVVTVHPESTELCGGTHVRATGDIGLFRIVQESSVASGVRRLVALTGAAALQHGRKLERQLREAADLFKSAPAEVPQRIDTAQKRLKELERKLEEMQLNASAQQGNASQQVQQIHGVTVLTQRVDPADINVLRQLADRYKERHPSAIIGLGGETADGKALILVAATSDVVKRGFKAGDAVKSMATTLGGKGGGKADMAQAGGTEPGKLAQAFEQLVAMVPAP